MSGTVSDNISKSSGLIKAASGGKIGQVVQTVLTDTTSGSATSWADITGLTVSITPTATSSKVLVLCDIKVSSTSGSGMGIRLDNNGSQTYVGDAASDRGRGTFGGFSLNSLYYFSMSFHYLDSPSTTSSATYKVQWFFQGGNTGYIGRSVSDTDYDYTFRTPNSITVMEVLA